MLPSGQQMLPLLWFLLWMPKFGLSSNIGLWDIFANPNDVNIPSRYARACEGVNRETTEKDAETNGDSFNDDLAMEPMVDINNEIYLQFTKSWQSVYMVFNKTNLRKAVPDPSLLCLAELNMKRRRKPHKQLLMLYERQRKNSWNYRSLRFLTRNDTSDWLWFDVTEVVRQWIKQKWPIEVFRLNRVSLGEEDENYLRMDISGVTPSGQSDHPDKENRPFLFIITSRPKQAQPVTSSQHP